MPLGPVDRRQAARRQRLRRRRPPAPRALDRALLVGLLGLFLAAGGVWLAAQPPRVDVDVSAQSFAVGDVSLAAAGGGVYRGSAGVVVVRSRGDRLLGSASSQAGGSPLIAACSGSVRTGIRCRFTVGTRSLDAVDTWRGGVWERHYDNGREVQLVMRAGTPCAVPVLVDSGPL